MKHLITILAVLFVALSSFADNFPIAQVTKNEIVYNLYQDGHAGVVGHKSNKDRIKNVSIIDEIKHKGKVYKVLSIEPSAFENKIIENISFPSHKIDVLHSKAFANTLFELAFLTLDVDSIGSNAMSGVSLRMNGELEYGVLMLGPHFRAFSSDAFSRFLSFNNFDIDVENPYYSSEYGFLLSKNGKILYRIPGNNFHMNNIDYETSDRKYFMIPENIDELEVNSVSDSGFTNINKDSENSFILSPNIKRVHRNALSKTNFYEIVCLSHTPPEAVDGIVNDTSFALQVPPKAINTYKQAEGWKNAESITPITDSNLLLLIDEPIISISEFEPYDITSLNEAVKNGNPYAAYHLADYAFHNWRFSDDYDVRQGWINEERDWLKTALDGLLKITNPEDEAIYQFYLGQVWNMISIPMMGGGAFEEDDALFDQSFRNAIVAYRKAGDLGYAPGYRELGKMWLSGWPSGGSGGCMVNDDYAPNAELGLTYINKANELGDKQAKSDLGAYYYSNGNKDRGINLIKEGINDASQATRFLYACEIAPYSDRDEIIQCFKKSDSWFFQKECEMISALSLSNDIEALFECAEYYRNGNYYIISLDKALALYNKLLNNKSISVEQKAYALWNCCELEFWLNPGEGHDDIQSLKRLATDPQFKHLKYADRAKALLGRYYDEIQENKEQSKKWFDSIDLSKNNFWHITDPYTLELIYHYYPSNDVKNYAKSRLDGFARDRLGDSPWSNNLSGEILYHYVNTLENYLDDDIRMHQYIVEEIKSTQAYKKDFWAELILVDYILANELYSWLKEIYESNRWSPVINAAYGRYLIESGKDLYEGIELMEFACDAAGSSIYSDYDFNTIEMRRTANYDASYCVRRDIWMAYLSQLYGQDGEMWGSDFLNVPKNTSRFYNRTKADRWKEASAKISWDGPSGW